MALPLNYPNPLDNFRSHSYHFILTVANSTEAHRKLLEKDAFMSAVNTTPLGEQLNLDGEKAFLLVDTRRYSQFSVTSFESSQIYGTGSPNNPSVPASATKMKIVDSTGITFFNLLSHTLKNRIQSTKASAFYMLAIIFTGHDDSNPQNTRTIATTFIPMVLLSMGFDFSSAGSTYDLEFMEVEGNPGAGISQLVEMGDIQAVSTEKRSNTVGGMLQALEDRLNLNSVRFYHKYTNEAIKLETGIDNSVPVSQNPGQIDRDTERREARTGTFTQAGKLVQYMITVPKEWENFTINTAGKSANIEQVFIAKTNTAKSTTDAAVTAAQAAGTSAAVLTATQKRDSYASFSYATTVPDAIRVILESSRQILDIASSTKAKAGLAQTHKCVVNITSDATTYLVHYDIYPYSAIKMEASADGTTVDARPKNMMTDGAVRNLLTYEYVFSGRNSHVLDMKIEFAPIAAALDVDLNLGQSRLADSSAAGQTTKGQKTASNDGLDESHQFNPLLRPGEPVFLPAKTREQQSHFSSQNTEELPRAEALANVKAKQEHTSTLASLHFLGSLQAQMTIRGNPNLFMKYADRNSRGGIAKHTLVMRVDDLKDITADSAEAFFNNSVRAKIVSGKQEYYDSYVKPRIEEKMVGPDPILHGSDISVSPMFAKINIYAPNVDFLGNTLPNSPQFTNTFFYNGVYLVALITHMFENGSFKQVLNLIPYDVSGAFSKQQAVSAGPVTRRGI